MKKLALFLAILSICLVFPRRSAAKTITIAVIDTGIDASNPKLCKMGHKSFIDDKPLVDNHGHGTHIAGLIAANAGDLDYCIVSLKFYSDSNTGQQNLANTVAAVRYATNIKVDYINYSGGGPEFDEQESLAVKAALKQKIKIFAAAGNEHENLDLKCDYFPACYDKKITMVGNLTQLKVPDWVRTLAYVKFIKDLIKEDPKVVNSTSNYGKRVSIWEVGTELESTMPGGKRGKMTGTSQATAVATGKAVKRRLAHE